MDAMVFKGPAYLSEFGRKINSCTTKAQLCGKIKKHLAGDDSDFQTRWLGMFGKPVANIFEPWGQGRFDT